MKRLTCHSERFYPVDSCFTGWPRFGASWHVDLPSPSTGYTLPSSRPQGLSIILVASRIIPSWQPYLMDMSGVMMGYVCFKYGCLFKKPHKNITHLWVNFICGMIIPIAWLISIPFVVETKKNMCYNHQKASSYLTKLWRNNFGDLPIVEHGDFPVHHVK